MTYSHIWIPYLTLSIFPGPWKTKPRSPSNQRNGGLGRYEPFWAPMLRWRWTIASEHKARYRNVADDRWRTAYDGSSLNRGPASRCPDEIEKKHFIGQAGRWFRRRCRNYRLLRVFGASTELIGQVLRIPGKKQKSHLLVKNNGVLCDRRPFQILFPSQVSKEENSSGILPIDVYKEIHQKSTEMTVISG